MCEYYTNADVECSGLSWNYVHGTVKLPGWTRDKRSKKVLLIRSKQRKEPELDDFIDFVDDENMIANDPVFSKVTVEQYIGRETKSRRVATYVSGSKEISVDLTVRSPCINCWENNQLAVAWGLWKWLWRTESTSHQRKSTVLDVCNQWSHNIMSRLMKKDWIVEPAVVVI